MDDLIYLEIDEEITSVIERLKHSKGVKLGIVVPRGAMVLQSVVNLKLIEREAEKAKKKVALITSDKVGRSLAMQVGVPVFDDAKQAEVAEPAAKLTKSPISQDVIEIDMSDDEEALPEGVNVHYYTGESIKGNALPKPEKKIIKPEPSKFATRKVPAEVGAKAAPTALKKRRKVKIIVSIIVLLLALVGCWVWFLRANVAITVPADSFEATADVIVDSTLIASDIEGGKIKGESVETQKELSKEVAATGTKKIGEKAKGTLTFYNSAGVDQNIAAQAVVTSDDGKKFTLDAAVTVPKATLDAGGKIVQGKSSGTVTAQESGTEYNMSSSTNYTVAGNSYVTAQGETSGGTSKEVKIVASSDIEQSKDQLLADAPKAMKEELTKLSTGKYILDSAIDYKVQDFSSNKKAGDEAEKFTVKAKVVAGTIVFVQDDLRKAVAKLAEKKTPEDKSLLISDADSIQPELKKMDIDKKELVVTAKLFTHIGQAVNTQGLAGKLRFKSVKGARAVVAAQTNLGVDAVSISLKPNFYWLRMPVLQKSISIKFNYQNK